MSIKDRLAGKSATIGLTPRQPQEQTEATQQRAKTGPGQMLHAMPFLAENEKQIAELREKLALAEQNVSGRKIPLAELHEVPGRRRKLSTDEYNELKNNLREYPLITPITTRKRKEGGYEIISGHNRVAIYAELGHTEILAIVQEFDDSNTELGALFANLFHPNLPDVQKYSAFKRLQEITGKSQKQLAEESGADPKSVSRWMSFDKLPSAALHLIESNPDKIGGTAAMAFATIASNAKKQDSVVEAIKGIVEGKLTQEAGVQLAKMNGKQPAKTPRAGPEIIRSGKKNYCKVLATKQTLRLDFETEEERIGMEDEIMKILAKRAETLKNG